MERLAHARAIILSTLVFAVISTCCASKWETDKNLPIDAANGGGAMGASTGCPKTNLGGMILEPCCTVDNQCGADSSAVGLGCKALDDRMFRAIATNPPPPQSCDGKPLAGNLMPAAASATPLATGAAGSVAPSSMTITGAAGSSPPDESAPSSTIARATSCPSATLGNMTLIPCCTPDNHCGADSSAVGLGCVDFADSMFRSLATNPPPPQTCMGMPL
jgi:hypothetical protein